jgi:uncharacterized protein (DUF58 family)
VPGVELTFPLVSRRRLIGLSFGGMRSARRGMGSDVAGSRPYRPGDDIDTIDWAASARLSSARDSDEFVVRERYAEEAPRVVVLCDRRPEMAFFAPPLPWLDKAAAMRRAVELVIESVAVARGFIGYLDYADGEPFWRPPQSEREVWQIRERHLDWPEFRAPADNLDQALGFLGEHRLALPAGSFLFVLSDFLAPPGEPAWLHALEHNWDVVPVVIQDPLWEQSFPDASGVVLPLADSRSGRVGFTRLTAREAAERREANETRLSRLVDDLRGLDLEPVLVSTSDQDDILAGFLEWTEQRLYARGRGW